MDIVRGLRPSPSTAAANGRSSSYGGVLLPIVRADLGSGNAHSLIDCGERRGKVGNPLAFLLGYSE